MVRGFEGAPARGSARGPTCSLTHAAQPKWSHETCVVPWAMDVRSADSKSEFISLHASDEQIADCGMWRLWQDRKRVSTRRRPADRRASGWAGCAARDVSSVYCLPIYYVVSYRIGSLFTLQSSLFVFVDYSLLPAASGRLPWAQSRSEPAGACMLACGSHRSDDIVVSSLDERE